MQHVFVWQSLVSASYRSFFIELKKRLPADDEMTLVSPKHFVELGSQRVECEPYGDVLEAGINFVPLETKSFHTQCVIFKDIGKTLKRMRGKGDVNLFCLAEVYSFTATSIFFSALFSLRKFFFATFASQNIVKKFTLLLALNQRFILSRSRVVLSLGNEQTEVLRHFGFTKKICYFPLWFDSRLFHFAPKKTSDKLRVGYLGSLSVDKGVPDLIDCFETFTSEFQEIVSLHIAGAGALAPSIPAALDQLKNRGLECEYLGPLKSTEVAIFFQSLHILVVPSRTCAHWKEQFGRVIVEAQACGCIVIGTNSGEIPTVIGNRDFIFAERNPEALKTALLSAVLSLKNDPTLPEFEARRAYERFSDCKTAESFAQNLRSFV